MPAQRCWLRKHINVRLGLCHANSGLDIITGNAIIAIVPSTTHVGAYKWKDLDARILDMPDGLFELLASAEHAGRELANDSRPLYTSSSPRDDRNS